MAVLMVSPDATDIGLDQLAAAVDIEGNQRLVIQSEGLCLPEQAEPRGRIGLTIGILQQLVIGRV